jgi:surfeit locus 1 family protein
MNIGQDVLDAPRPRSRTLRISVAIIATLMFAGFFALGTWQVFRLQWKLALIERVGQRVHAAPVAAPAAAEWPQVGGDSHEYRHVQLRGVYLLRQATRVLASTERGVGYWMLTPLCRDDGSIVMVNRGFVPAGEGGWKAHAAPPLAGGGQACQQASGPAVAVTGLLRLSERSGGVLRQNEPARNYWYTRDLPAIAQARGLPPVAPYFVDADANGEAWAGLAPGGEGAQPLAGLTVVSFPNNHLVYAITWFALALMMAAAAAWVVRDARKGRAG